MIHDLLRLYADSNPALLTLAAAGVLLIAVCAYALGRHTATCHAEARGYEEGRWDADRDAARTERKQAVDDFADQLDAFDNPDGWARLRHAIRHTPREEDE